MARRSKFGNQKVALLDGFILDSKREARRWGELQLLERAGQITHLQRQIKFVLIPAGRYPSGKSMRETAYIADFTYWEGGARVCEDAKGFKTPEYRIKRKLMFTVHGIEVIEV